MRTHNILARMQLQFEVDQFYYHEAALLDERRYEEWLHLLADEIHYWMPIRRTRTVDELEREFSSEGAMAFFDDDKTMLDIRVRRLRAAISSADNPPSRTRHNISNIRVISRRGTTITAESNFHIYRSRLDAEEDHWFGLRRDALRRARTSFEIVKRSIFLDHTVILSKNLSTFF